jgi:hypothetical protein
MCFVELDSSGLYSAMTYELGGVLYGNCVAFRIPVKQVQN